MKLAAFDVGTNTVLMLLVESDGAGKFKPILERSRITRLGKGVDRTGKLDKETSRLTLDTIAEFAEAARAAGGSPLAIMLRYVLPNVFGPVIVYATTLIGLMIVVGSGLSFLGLGVQPPTADWGAMVADGRVVLRRASHVTILPGAIILVVGINLLHLLGVAFVGTVRATMRGLERLRGWAVRRAGWILAVGIYCLIALVLIGAEDNRYWVAGALMILALLLASLVKLYLLDRSRKTQDSTFDAK